MAGNHNSGRKPKYLTIKRFEEFINNDFWHIKQEVWHAKWYAKASFWISLAILTAIIAKFIMA